MLDLISRNDPPPITHPGFFYGQRGNGVKFALQLGLIALLAAAVYYRVARHDAGKYYLLFGAWIVILAIYVFRYAKNTN
jgi:hypothetical protein